MKRGRWRSAGKYAQKQVADAKQIELKQAVDESEKRALALEQENTAQKQVADAKQMELQQALNESEKRARRSLFSAALEISQLIIPGRHARSDFLVDAFGACVGIFAGSLLRSMRIQPTA